MNEEAKYWSLLPPGFTWRIDPEILGALPRDALIGDIKGELTHSVGITIHPACTAREALTLANNLVSGAVLAVEVEMEFLEGQRNSAVDAATSAKAKLHKIREVCKEASGMVNVASKIREILGRD